MAISLSIGVEVIGDGIGSDGGERSTRGIAGMARRLESAGVSYWVIGAGRAEVSAGHPASLDPCIVATVAARHSSDLGIVVAAAAHRDHPYNLARRLVSVDHAAHGRVGWLALDYDHPSALNSPTDTWTGAELDAAHTSDAVAAVRTLWRTWPLESIVGDLGSGVFADARLIRRADVSRGYAISGPLNVPGSIQGDLPIWRTAEPGADPEGADLVVVADGEPVPSGIPAVVRLPSVARLDEALQRLSDTDGVVGVLLRLTPRELEHVLDDVLPAARRRSLIDGPGSGPLRERLRLPARTEPDLSGHAVAFDTVPNPGGRL